MAYNEKIIEKIFRATGPKIIKMGKNNIKTYKKLLILFFIVFIF